MKNYAFSDEVEGWDADKDVETLDLISSSWYFENMSGFAKLKKLRLARLDFKKLIIHDLPSLECVDVSLCIDLQDLTIKNCPELRAIDLSFDSSLETFNTDCMNVEYLSVPSTSLRSLPKLPNLKYLDVCFCNNLEFDLQNFPKLELLCFFNVGNNVERLSTISKSSLRVYDSHHCVFNFDSFCKKSRLELVSVPNGVLMGKNPERFKFVTIAKGSRSNDIPDIKEIYGEIDPDPEPFEWEKAHLLLYGPWGIPPGDMNKSFTVQPVERPLFDESQAVDAILGAIFGSALMDMLGVGTEFADGLQSKHLCRGPVSVLWSHPRVSQHTASFIRGTATDDTSQAVLIMRTLCSQSGHSSNMVQAGTVRVDLRDFAERMKDWMVNGHQEHKDRGGLGLGLTVKSVLNHPLFLEDPIGAAKAVAEPPRSPTPSNGSVMRTTPTGCFRFWDEKTTIELASLFSSATHCDPRCRFTAVAISLIVSRIIRSRLGLLYSFNLDDTIEDAISATSDGLEPFIDEIRKYSTAESIEDLYLDEPQKIGYCLKAYGSAVWCLRSFTSITPAIEAIVRAGGDSDTNGAVVGAVMGALVGFNRLPRHLLKYMYNGQWLFNEASCFLAHMGLESISSPFMELLNETFSK